MPAYNAEKYIEQSILSVNDQTYQHWELIVVNDGSTDGTLKIAEDRAREDKRIRVISQENSRLGAARNTGIENAKGEWIAFLDSDDLWDSTKLERQVELINRIPEVELVYTGGWIFNGDDKANTTVYPSVYGKFAAPEMYRKLYESNYVPVLSVLAKIGTIKKIGPQEQQATYYGCEDWDYWLRACLVGATFYGIDEKLFYYRRHDNNMSGNGLKMQMAQTAVMLKNYRHEFDSDGNIKKHLKNVVNPLISRVISDGRNDDALFLLNGMASIRHNNSYKLRAWLVKIFGKQAFYPVRAIAKLMD